MNQSSAIVVTDGMLTSQFKFSADGLHSQSEETDRERHSVICHRLEDRRKLYRVAEIAQKLFYIHRELTCAKVEVKQVQRMGDTLVLWGSVRAPGSSYCGCLALSLSRLPFQIGMDL